MGKPTFNQGFRTSHADGSTGFAETNDMRVETPSGQFGNKLYTSANSTGGSKTDSHTFDIQGSYRPKLDRNTGEAIHHPQVFRTTKNARTGQSVSTMQPYNINQHHMLPGAPQGDTEAHEAGQKANRNDMRRVEQSNGSERRAI